MATKERIVPVGDEEVTESAQPLAKPPLKKSRSLLDSVLWENDIVSPVDEVWDAES